MMRAILFSFLCLLARPIPAQTKFFDLDKLDSADFRSFMGNKKVLVVGEMHGTEEVPTLVLKMIRQLHQSGQPLTVGLEIPSDHQQVVESFLKKGDFSRLLQLEYFQYPDGRTSVAMGQLIRGLRDLKDIRVICFDIDSKLSSSINRDSVMGVNLSKGYQDGYLVMLTGNLHANLKEGYWRPNFKSAVYHFSKLRKLDDQLLSLNTYFGSGTIWNCMQDGCKEREVQDNSSLKKGIKYRNFIAVYDAALAGGYHGVLYIDRVTASPPMVTPK